MVFSVFPQIPAELAPSLPSCWCSSSTSPSKLAPLQSLCSSDSVFARHSALPAFREYAFALHLSLPWNVSSTKVESVSRSSLQLWSAELNGCMSEPVVTLLRGAPFLDWPSAVFDELRYSFGKAKGFLLALISRDVLSIQSSSHPGTSSFIFPTPPHPKEANGQHLSLLIC